jgi:IS30 family transposase
MKEKRKYKHLSFEERYVIEKLLKKKLKIRDIAELLNRSPNTISYEINKNIVNGEYLAKKAQHKSYFRRYRSKRQCLKVSMDRFLTRFVEKKLRDKWSPKQISGYL